jgi:AcrR family transcriptional regulator
MANESVDRRVRKTQKQLRQGLTELLEEKSAKNITVRELCQRVDINRGTFYLHYRDIFDLVDQIEKEMFEDFHNVLDKHPLKSLMAKPLPMLIDVFRFVSKNSDMCKVLIGENGDLTFINRLKDLVKNRCLDDWMKIFNTGKTKNFEYYYSFIVAGCIGLLQTWVESGLKESPEQMASLAEQMIMTGINVLK